MEREDKSDTVLPEVNYKDHIILETSLEEAGVSKDVQLDFATLDYQR